MEWRKWEWSGVVVEGVVVEWSGVEGVEGVAVKWSGGSGSEVNWKEWQWSGVERVAAEPSDSRGSDSGAEWKVTVWRWRELLLIVAILINCGYL